MPRLVYWYARCLNDSNAYSIRERTKREALRRVAEHHKPNDYGPVVKVIAEYTNAFELAKEAMGEGSLWAETDAHFNKVSKK